ncbi:MAG: type III-A CRISPR-associated RAMP protein Csm4 [Candidatus Margulisbacteria bacterium]|nr:type III-A CRISPR-associated RAMP protein Csm4 [Candidatus Margulisiibacteriota bacterium]
MQTLKVVIKPLSSFSTTIHSDTLFGAFCWNYLDKYGADKLKKILDCNAVVFSNIFPEGYLPCPIIPNGNKVVSSVKEYASIKKLKKIRYLPISCFQDQLSINKLLSLKETLIDSVPLESKDQVVVRNAIDRNTGTGLSGALFSDSETFYKENTSLCFYVRFNENVLLKEEVTEVVKLLTLFGIGKDKSTGKGSFEKQSINESDLPLYKGEKHFISLSNGLPDDACELEYGKLITKYSKHGRGSLFRKNPVQLYVEGSLFKITEPKDYYGTYLDNVSLQIGHKHHACLFPMFIDIDLSMGKFV